MGEIMALTVIMVSGVYNILQKTRLSTGFFVFQSYLHEIVKEEKQRFLNMLKCF